MRRNERKRNAEVFFLLYSGPSLISARNPMEICPAGLRRECLSCFPVPFVHFGPRLNLSRSEVGLFLSGFLADQVGIESTFQFFRLAIVNVAKKNTKAVFFSHKSRSMNGVPDAAPVFFPCLVSSEILGRHKMLIEYSAVLLSLSLPSPTSVLHFWDRRNDPGSRKKGLRST